MEAGDAYGIKGKDRFFYDDLTLNKMEENKAEFLMWLGKDEKIYFTIKHEDFENNWAIDIRSKENIYDFLGEAGKYPVSLVSSINDDMLIDKGSALLGAQRHGYHEYILNGDDVQSKLHIRYLPVGDEKMWLAFTGYETKPTPESSDEGLNDARADKFIKM